MTPIEVLKMLKSKIDEADFYKSNYVLQTNDVEAINQALRIHDVVGQSEQLKAVQKLKDFAYEVCPLHREDDLEEIVGSL